MPAAVIQQALDAWREGERLLGELEPLTADHEAVSLQLVRIREAYGELSAIPAPSRESIHACAARIEAARDTMQTVRDRQGNDS